MSTLTPAAIDPSPARPAVAVPVSATTIRDALAAATQARGEGAEIIEWRLDALSEPELSVAAEHIAALREACGTAILATYRSRLEGGPGDLDDDGYRDLLLELLSSGAAAIDVELTRGEEIAAPIARAAREHGVLVVGSSHDFEATPDDLDARFAELARRGADVLKVAVTPRSDTDVLRLLTAAIRARHELGRAVVPVAMGPLGVLTRVGGALWQAPFTFARVGSGSAPGQLDAADTHAVLSLLAPEPSA